MVDGRTAVVTGASSGIGYETARELARLGADVILACRDVAKGEKAADAIAAESAADSDLRVVRLDLASLASVHEAATAIREQAPQLDLLINNAGVMAIPFGSSEDGFELTFATNHLGHFALTGLLLERLLATPGSRVVTVSSVAHRRARAADLDEPVSEARYSPGAAYERSKLANLLFAYELQRRLSASDATTISVAAHPGIVRTPLWRTSSRFERALIALRLGPLTSWLAQDARSGALPTLRAALDPTARGGEYYGPGGRFEYTGPPVPVESSAESHDADAQRRLWERSEQLTGISEFRALRESDPR